LHFVCVLVGEDAEEDEVEENPIAIDFQDVQDAFYMKDPRKALQGFFDREGTFSFIFFSVLITFIFCLAKYDICAHVFLWELSCGS